MFSKIKKICMFSVLLTALFTFPTTAMAENGANGNTPTVSQQNPKATNTSKLEAKVLSENFVATEEQVQKSGVNRIFKNIQFQFTGLWGFIFTLSAIAGLASCLYGVLKFKEASRQDSDSQKDPLNRKGLWGLIIGVALLSFSAVIALFADSAGIGGVMGSGVKEGNRIGEDALDGRGIGY